MKRIRRKIKELLCIHQYEIIKKLVKVDGKFVTVKEKHCIKCDKVI